MLELAVDGATVFFLFQGLTLVEAVLASCEVDVEFGTPVLVNKQKSGDDGETRTFDGLLQATYLSAIQEELTVAPGSMVVIRSIEVRRDIHVLDPYFAMENDAISVHQTGLAEADALDFRPCQYQPGRVFAHQIIIELRFAVLDIDGFLFLFCHNRLSLLRDSP